MSEFKVENVGPPPTQGACRVKYPWDEMSVGDSFFVPNVPLRRLTNSFATPRRKGFKVAARTVTENGVKGVRVWRVE